MKLITGEQAQNAVLSRGLTALAQDGWDYIMEEQPSLSALFRQLVAAGKMTEEHATGAMLFVGMTLRAERGDG